MTASPVLKLKAQLSRAHFTSARLVDAAQVLRATWRTKHRLRLSGPIQVLVDTSVMAKAVAFESTWVSTGLQPWGNMLIDSGYQARVPVSRRPPNEAGDDEKRDFSDVCFLTGIAQLAKIGLIQLCSSGELNMEQWRRPTGESQGYTIFSRSLFEGVQIHPVDDMAPFAIGPSQMNYPSLETQQRERLQQSEDKLFKALVRRLGEKNNQDAWHIRTAQAHGMYCFLTADYKLMKNLREQGRHEPICSLTTKVMSPTQLGQAIGLAPLEPRHVAYEGASVPVRTDLHMPGNKRKQKRKG